MESRVKLLGHPVHPMLIVLPLGLLSTAVLFDILYVITGNGDLATFSYWAMAAGIIGGLAAAVFGLLDWLSIPDDTRAKRIGAFHGVGNLIVVILFMLSFWLRLDDAQYLPNYAPLLAGVLGAIIALGTAWLGGELVYRLGVGVDEGAHLDAPSSIGGDAAAAVARGR